MRRKLGQAAAETTKAAELPEKTHSLRAEAQPRKQKGQELISEKSYSLAGLVGHDVSPHDTAAGWKVAVSFRRLLIGRSLGCRWRLRTLGASLPVDRTRPWAWFDGSAGPGRRGLRLEQAR